MKITTNDVRSVVKLLDEIIEQYSDEKPMKERDWRTYEQQLACRMKIAMELLHPLIIQATESIEFLNLEPRGRKPNLTLSQKVELLLIKHFIDKSNREMANMLVIFSILSRIETSYKSIERLYSDEKVFMALLNLHSLILKNKGIENPNCTGDGTGYSLTIKHHYASMVQQRKEKSNDGFEGNNRFIYSFRLMDLETRMYIAYGTGLKSEQEAFFKAMMMVGSVGIQSIRLDRYYSCQKYLSFFEALFGKDIDVYLIPKKNATVKGSWKWKRMLDDFVNDTESFLEEYFQRNQSESAFAEDKRRFGWKIAQKRPDRIDTHNFCTTIWHNMLWMAEA
jgi:transposase